VIDDQIIKAYQSGESGHAIARRLNLSPTQVYWILKQQGVKCRSSSEGLTNWWHKTMGKDYAAKRIEGIKMLKEKIRGKDIAEKLGVSRGTVSNWKRKEEAWKS